MRKICSLKLFGLTLMCIVLMLVTQVSSSCTDKLSTSTCSLLDPSYYCVGDYRDWAYENCRSFCGLCGQPAHISTTQTPTTQTAHQLCVYKCGQYTQGETWYDGCQYQCTCVDASIGYYRCKDRCPKYTNLPSGCTMVQDAGTCCQKPSCGFSFAMATLRPMLIVGGASSCVYKGNYYAQDESWSDGCSQTCTCVDAANGQYSCHAVCLRWDALPCTCHMNPAPAGLCCEQPWCPSSVTIKIPKSYKDQYPGYIYV